VVAAENFWGSLVSQIGGNKVNVTSVVSDPNADPHEYESNSQTALKFNDADYVILNGAGYDSWADKLISASSTTNKKILTVSTLLGKKNGDNPHFWYSPSYLNQTIKQMNHDLDGIDPSDANYFNNNYSNLVKSLSVYQNKIASIKQQYGGTKVAATEDIFVYLANASGLDLVSPNAFMQAVAEGNDPPTDSVVSFEQQLSNRDPKILIYNEQTVTPLTNSIKQLAKNKGIPYLGISETVEPPNEPFQAWMNQEVDNLNNLLKANTN
jgi:zinc/manganese transport system substrate-binding protein